MKTLIAYASKSGASKECARLLAERLPGSTVCDLSGSMPPLNSFDAVILGSGIRIGKTYGSFRKFLKNYGRMLLSKKFAFYLCGASPESLQEAIEKNIPPECRKNAKMIAYLGGKKPFSKEPGTAWLIKENLDSLAEAMQAPAP